MQHGDALRRSKVIAITQGKQTGQDKQVIAAGWVVCPGSAVPLLRGSFLLVKMLPIYHVLPRFQGGCKMNGLDGYKMETEMPSSFSCF
jgi:hypothetical protein